MDAYDAAVHNYAVATQQSKLKPGLLGIAPGVPNVPTPPKDNDEVDSRNYLYQLLRNLEEMILNKTSLPLSHLMEICSTKQSQTEAQIVSTLEMLLGELRKICKSHPGAMHLLTMSFEASENPHQGALNTETVCKSLTILLKTFSLNNGLNNLKSHFRM